MAKNCQPERTLKDLSTLDKQTFNFLLFSYSTSFRFNFDDLEDLEDKKWCFNFLP